MRVMVHAPQQRPSEIGHFHVPDVGHTLPAPGGRKGGGLGRPPSTSADGLRYGKGDVGAGLPDVRQGAVPVGAVGFPAVAFPAGPFGVESVRRRRAVGRCPSAPLPGRWTVGARPARLSHQEMGMTSSDTVLADPSFLQGPRSRHVTLEVIGCSGVLRRCNAVQLPAEGRPYGWPGDACAFHAALPGYDGQHLASDIRHQLERSMATRATLRPEPGRPVLSPSHRRQERASRAAR